MCRERLWDVLWKASLSARRAKPGCSRIVFEVMLPIEAYDRKIPNPNSQHQARRHGWTTWDDRISSRFFPRWPTPCVAAWSRRLQARRTWPDLPQEQFRRLEERGEYLKHAVHDPKDDYYLRPSTPNPCRRCCPRSSPESCISRTQQLVVNQLQTNKHRSPLALAEPLRIVSGPVVST